MNLKPEKELLVFNKMKEECKGILDKEINKIMRVKKPVYSKLWFWKLRHNLYK